MTAASEVRSKEALRRLIREMETTSTMLPSAAAGTALSRRGERERVARLLADSANVLRRCFNHAELRGWLAGLPEDDPPSDRRRV